ncbi:aminopeptidase N [Georgenia sp. Z1491]|uniref:aminopeptidase N n=1 Tax=Georgenia sp. Z1491 TaxID=3416707 RepID=UPI003CFB7B9E
MPAENLTRAEAAERASLVATQTYRVELDLTRGPEVFGSTTTLTFTATPGSSTFVDLIAPAVHRITLNGADVDTSAFADSRIALSGLAQTNELVVEAEGAYMTTGEGLHRFVDPVDEKVYLYSQFEVADARRVFACFEQPDLKAEFSFVVTAPAQWTVFSNEAAAEVTDAAAQAGEVDGAGARTWTFAPTARISTYLTAIVAGPYAGTTGELTSSDGRTIPLGVYARASIAEHLDAETIMDVTRQGFAFYEEAFDRPYPFTKYDQVFVPEFNAGAMENVGLVTYLENYVFRGPVSGAVRERRVITILHELAHMWFGDLVTMRWWNDLWLNESFAEYASHLSAAEGLGIDDAWVTFTSLEKAWALDQDQLPTTHPIVASIEDLEDVEVNFDGITYAKGSSVLTQLVTFVGRDAFLTGLRRYFATHAFGNTELSDLLVELEAASGRDLRSWSTVWLESAGVTTLVPEVTTETGDDSVERIASAAVVQTVPEAHPVQRPHRLAVAGYDLDGDRLVRSWSDEVDVDGERTELPTLVGRPWPAVLLVNDEDLTYAKVRLDDRSLASATRHVDAFAEAMPRTLVLASAWDMTRDGQWAASRYLDLALRALASETQPTAMRVLLANVRTAVERYSDPATRDRVRAAVADDLVALATGADPGSDAQLQLSRAAAQLAVTDEQVATVRGWIDGSGPLPGQEVDPQQRWEVLRGLALAGALTEDDVTAALDADPSATGREHAVWVRSARPTAEAKQWVWDNVVAAANLPNTQQRYAALGFADVRDPAVLAPFVRPYLDSLTRVWAEQTNEMAQNVVTYAFPAALAGRSAEAGVDVVTETRAWLDAHAEAPAALRRLVAERLDTAERAVRAQAVDAGR